MGSAPERQIAVTSKLKTMG